MAYVIKVTYKDGDTDNSWTAHGEIDLGWTTKEQAKAALKRLGERNEWTKHCSRGVDHCWKHTRKNPCPPKPEWLNENEDLVLLNGEGKEVTVYPDWDGYFSSLIEARVTEKDDPEMVYEP